MAVKSQRPSLPRTTFYYTAERSSSSSLWSLGSRMRPRLLRRPVYFILVMNILPKMRIARVDVRVFSISLLMSTYSVTYALLVFRFDPVYPWGFFLNWFIFKMSLIVRRVAKLLFAYRKKRNNHFWGPPRKKTLSIICFYQKCLFLNHSIL